MAKKLCKSKPKVQTDEKPEKKPSFYSAEKVSIIVPVYRAEDYLQQCIESILTQTYSNLEVILVDDGSPDKCPILCDMFAEADTHIQVIHKKNEGAALARKAGVEVATGEYVLFIDCDDWLEANTISDCLDIVHKDNTDCVMFGYVREYPQKSIHNPLFPQSFSCDLAQSEKYVHRRIVGPITEELRNPQKLDFMSPVWGKLYRLSTAKNGCTISERIVGTSEDTIFNLYALDGCKISYINKCFYHYRKSNAQSITTQHKPDLAEKWDVMYGIMQEYIGSSGRADEYHTPFLNRVACGMIGLGLNEIGSTESIWKKSQRLREILDKPLYREAFAQLDISYCGAKWKLFFLFCKKCWTFLLAVLLQIMNYLRSRMAA